ncbi:MAG: hypothetical protein K8R73_03175 [Clostridiales bacterium]|nr:hypothetical protein [Clostridiales bacterium]
MTNGNIVLDSLDKSKMREQELLSMPKLPVVSGKKMVAALKKDGFGEVRQNLHQYK